MMRELCLRGWSEYLGTHALSRVHLLRHPFRDDPVARRLRFAAAAPSPAAGRGTAAAS